MHWTKSELHAYIYLLCANADGEVTKEEIQLIKSRVEPEIFDKIHKEFENDSEKRRLEKIEYNVDKHTYSQMELAELRNELHQIFISDQKFHLKEKILDGILDNLLY